MKKYLGARKGLFGVGTLAGLFILIGIVLVQLSGLTVRWL